MGEFNVNKSTGELVPTAGLPRNYPAAHVAFDNTDTDLSSTDVQNAIAELESNFQDGVDAVYTACAAKGSTPTSHALSDVVTAIGNIEGGGGITPTGTKSITSNGTYDVTNYASANVNVPNTNSGTYPATTRAASIDMGATNSYRYVNTNSVPNTNSGTYTASSSSSALDMGATNTYRYVNTSALTKVSGTKSITANGTGIDVKAYEKVNVSVPNVAAMQMYTSTSATTTYNISTSLGNVYGVTAIHDAGTYCYGIINSSGAIQSWAGATNYFSLTRNSSTSFTIKRISGSGAYSIVIYAAS